MPRNLEKEIKNLEKSKSIKLLGIETDGILTRPVIESAIDSINDTWEQIPLDNIAESVNQELKEFTRVG